MAERESEEMTKILSLSLLLMFLSGCIMPLKGGRAGLQTPSGIIGVVEQPQNPKDESKQVWERQENVDGTVSEKVTTVIGAAQKDLAREMAAKLSSLKWVTLVGVLVFLFGAASAFWPPLKIIVGSVTTSAVACAAGLALIVLPVVVVGNELLILGGSVGALAVYWFAHRHSRASTEARVYKELLDKNKDGIDDRNQ